MINQDEERSQTRPRRRSRRRRGSERELRSFQLTFRVTASQAARIRALAARRGLCPSEFIRRAVLGRPMPDAVPAVNREIWAKLGPVAADLNVCIQAIQRGEAAPEPLALCELLRREIIALRDELLGRAPVRQ